MICTASVRFQKEKNLYQYNKFIFSYLAKENVLAITTTKNLFSFDSYECINYVIFYYIDYKICLIFIQAQHLLSASRTRFFSYFLESFLLLRIAVFLVASYPMNFLIFLFSIHRSVDIDWRSRT